MTQLERVSHCLDMFCSASGQRVSVAKTRIFFLKNVSAALANDISRRSGFQVTTDLGRYLGVPLLHQRVTKQIYIYVVDNL